MDIGDDEAIVIDVGSHTTRVGICGLDAPNAIFHTIVGRENRTDIFPKLYVGPEAHKCPVIDFPVQRGIITDWDGYERILKYSMDSVLKASLESHPIILTESAMCPSTNRETLTKVLFEKFNSMAMYIGIQGIFSLFAAGKVTGVTVDCGEGVTQVTPIYEGYALPHAMLKSNFGGRDLTNFLGESLRKRQYCSSSTMSYLDLCKLKEKHCYFAWRGFGVPVRKLKRVECELPDGKVVHLNEEQIRVPELLFNSKLMKSEVPGIHKMTLKSLRLVAADEGRSELARNIVLAGGSTMFKHIETRLLRELKKEFVRKLSRSVSLRGLRMKPPGFKIKAVPERCFAVWIGGSILGSLSTFAQMWVRREEYEEIGVDIIHRKCF